MIDPDGGGRRISLPDSVGSWWYEARDGRRWKARVLAVARGGGDMTTYFRAMTEEFPIIDVFDRMFYRLDDPIFARWLGPENLEPLPMPLAGPDAP